MALKVYQAYEPCVARKIDAMYAALNAALNPPPEPEIEVTYEMMCAGMNSDGLKGFEKIPDRDSGLFVAKIYRSMRRLAPDYPNSKPQQGADIPVQTGPVRFTGETPAYSTSTYRSYNNEYPKFYGWRNGLKND